MGKDEEEKSVQVANYVKKKIKLKPNFRAENITGLIKSTKSNENREMLEINKAAKRQNKRYEK